MTFSLQYGPGKAGGGALPPFRRRIPFTHDGSSSQRGVLSLHIVTIGISISSIDMRTAPSFPVIIHTATISIIPPSSKQGNQVGTPQYKKNLIEQCWREAKTNRVRDKGPVISAIPFP